MTDLKIVKINGEPAFQPWAEKTLYPIFNKKTGERVYYDEISKEELKEIFKEYYTKEYFRNKVDKGCPICYQTVKLESYVKNKGHAYCACVQ